MVGVGGVVVDRGRVLLIRRAKSPLKGRWNIPGGTVELGETLEKAVVRELHEETGVLVRPAGVLGLFERISLRRGRTAEHFVVADFLCRRLGGRTRAGSDALEVIWAQARQLQSLRLPRAARQLVEVGLALARRSRRSRRCAAARKGATLLR